MQKLSQLFYLLLLSQKMHSLQHCPVLEFLNISTDTLYVSENSHVSLTFWLNTSGCKQSGVTYRIEVHTKMAVGSCEYDGKIIQSNICTEVESTAVGCLSAAGPARLYKLLNRSHEEIEWTWTWKDFDIKTMKKGLKLYVFYPPSVKNLTVDGNDVNGTYLINDSQTVSISCSFEKGRPAANFSLLDKNGRERPFSTTEGSLNQSFTSRCDDDWPNISCEGNGSNHNRSVSFLVRCPPRFLNKSAKVLNSSVYKNVTLHVRAHTVTVTRCVLTSLSSCINTQREVNCSLNGNPPDLVLVFQLDNNDSCTEWILALHNEKGYANITLSLSQDLKGDATEKDQTITDNGHSYLPFFSVLPVIVIALAISVVIVIKRSRKQNYDKRTRSEDARRTSRDNVRESCSGVAFSAAGVSDVAARTEKMASTSTSDGRNADGLIYGDLDFSNPRTTHEVITGDVQETEYAAINFTAVVPPPSAYRQKTDRSGIHKRAC